MNYWDSSVFSVFGVEGVLVLCLFLEVLYGGRYIFFVVAVYCQWVIL